MVIKLETKTETVTKEHWYCDVCKQEHTMSCSKHKCDICGCDVCSGCEVHEEDYEYPKYCPTCWALGESYRKILKETTEEFYRTRNAIERAWKDVVLRECEKRFKDAISEQKG